MRVPLKSLNFSKSEVLDNLLSVKLISKERNHEKAGFNGSDLMALDSNVMLARNGTPLPHCSPHPSPQSAGVYLFSQICVFPPFRLAGPVLTFLYSFRIPFTIVVPQLSHYSY